jgi:hypothetical protein
VLLFRIDANAPEPAEATDKPNAEPEVTVQARFPASAMVQPESWTVFPPVPSKRTIALSVLDAAPDTLALLSCPNSVLVVEKFDRIGADNTA